MKLGRRRWDRRRKLCPAEPTELCPAEQNAVTLQDTSTKGPPQTDTQSPRRHPYMTRVGGCETRKSPSSNRISANLRPQDCVLVRRAFGPTACQILSHWGQFVFGHCHCELTTSNSEADGLVQERRAAEKRRVRNQQRSKAGEATSGTVTDCILAT